MKFLRQLRNKWVVARSLGGGMVLTSANAVLLCTLALVGRLRFRGMRVPVVHTTEAGRHCFWVGSGSDETVLNEVFVRQEYAVPVSPPPRTIVDVGGNVGYAALFFAARFPDATVHTIEPDPENYARLERNTKRVARIRPANCALGDTRGSLRFFRSVHSGMSSSLVPRPGAIATEVTGTTLDDFLAERGIATVDLLKFDVEGAELRLFRGSRSLSAIRAIVGEVHEDLQGVSLEEFLALLPDFSIEVRKTKPQRYVVFGINRSAIDARG